MTIDRRRHGRQIRLADIGEAGQAKLCAATVELCGAGFARSVEERYVRSAGMSVIDSVEGRVGEAADVSVLGLRHAPAREVGEGALRALLAIRGALGISS